MLSRLYLDLFPVLMNYCSMASTVNKTTYYIAVCRCDITIVRYKKGYTWFFDKIK